MDKIAYAVGLFAASLVIIAGSYLDSPELRIIGGLTFGVGAMKVFFVK